MFDVFEELLLSTWIVKESTWIVKKEEENNMLPSNFKTTWVLSESTKAKWTKAGTIILERRKKDILGRSSLSAYKVFIKPLTYLTIYEKNKAIRKRMDELIEEESIIPVNFNLYDNYIIQLSLFKRKEIFEPYYGIHILDLEEQIQPASGINLTDTEFSVFIQMLEEWYGNTIEKKKTKGKKRKLNLEDNVQEKEKKKKQTDTAKEKKEKKKQFFVILYGWEWIYYGSENGKCTQEGGLFISSRLCEREAMKCKPAGDYKLKIIEHKQFFDIDFDMIETAVGYLINKNIDLYKELYNIYTEDIDLYDQYGPEILRNISNEEIFDLCKMVIMNYQTFSEEDNLWLEQLVSTFNKNESILIRLRLDNFKPYLMSVFEFVEDT